MKCPICDSCDICDKRFRCFTQKDSFVSLKYCNISKDAMAGLIFFDVTLPPEEVHCTRCGREAILYVRTGGSGYNVDGSRWGRFKSFYKCPKFPHSILKIREGACIPLGAYWDSGDNPIDWYNSYV